VIRRQRRLTYVVVAALILAGVAAIVARSSIKRAMPLPAGDSVWRLSYEVVVEAAAPASSPTSDSPPTNTTGGAPLSPRVNVALPTDTSRTRLFGQSMSYAGLSGRIVRGRERGEQVLVLTDIGPDIYWVSATFDLHVSPTADWRPTPASASMTADEIAAYLKQDRRVGAKNATITGALRQLRRDVTDKHALVDRIHRYCNTRIQSTGDLGADTDGASALSVRRAGSLGIARAMVALCRASKVPARIVRGFDIGGGDMESMIEPRAWVEVYDTDAGWRPYDPESGFAGEVPATYVPVRFGDLPIIRAFGGVEATAHYEIGRAPTRHGLLGPDRRHPAEALDLTRLPLATQRTLSLLLILPLGALVTALLRNVIGVRTFGTFTPALLALAFIFADWTTGLILIAVVALIGFASRHVLDKLKLMMVARLGVMLTIVVLCMILGVSLMDYFGLTASGDAVLLPIVITTMVIERAYISSEEDGVGFTTQLIAGTALVSLCCFALMRWELLGRWVVAYPETHLITLGLLVGLGRYSGYRLTELWRFADLAMPRGSGDGGGDA